MARASNGGNTVFTIRSELCLSRKFYIATGIVSIDLSLTLHRNRPVCFYLVVQRDILYVSLREYSLRWHVQERAEPLKGATLPKGGLATLPTTPPPLAGGSAREVSDLAV